MSRPQHLDALERANTNRMERAAVKAWVKEPGESVESRERLAAVLDGPLPDSLRTLRLEDFLMWGFRLPPVRRRACFRVAKCGPFRTLGELSDRQRGVVAYALRMSVFDLGQARDVHEFDAIHRRAAA